MGSGWRRIVISQSARLSLSDNYLIIQDWTCRNSQMMCWNFKKPLDNCAYLMYNIVDDE